MEELHTVFVGVYEVLAEIAREFEQRGDKSEVAGLKQIMVDAILGELKRLIELEKSVETADRQRIEHKLSVAVIPGQEAFERLLRYETHFSREIDKIHQLE